MQRAQGADCKDCVRHEVLPRSMRGTAMTMRAAGRLGMIEINKERGGLAVSNGAGGNGVPGIIIAGGWPSPESPGEEVPRIAAFIWGGKVRPAPTLPFGRWKGAA